MNPLKMLKLLLKRLLPKKLLPKRLLLKMKECLLQKKDLRLRKNLCRRFLWLLMKKKLRKNKRDLESSL